MNRVKHKVLFDVIHPAHINFFKHAIGELSQNGFEILLTYLDRGIVKTLIGKELPQHNPIKIGSYRNSRIGKGAMVSERALLFSRLLRQESPSVTLGVGDFILAVSSRLTRIPAIQFYDDFEFAINFKLSHLFADTFVVPQFIPVRGNDVIAYNGYKELAYLHPEVYTPDSRVISKIGLEKNTYVFAREVSGISLNYANLDRLSLLPIIKHLHSKGVHVLLSLEDKSLIEQYEPYCQVLEEPLEDIYSLIAFSRFGLSSGDSMAREMALLGVPCIYVGGRDMCINNQLILEGGIKKIEALSQVTTLVDQWIECDPKTEWANSRRKLIADHCVNTTDIIVSAVEKTCHI